jgi:large subunit ribosomal protein L25
MKSVSLSGSPRENVGKKDAATLRNQDLIPCVLYGGDKQYHFYVVVNEVKKVVYTPEVYKVELDLNGEKHWGIIQEIQFHPVSDKILHIDFLEMFDDKVMRVGLPLRMTGSAIGVRNGGKLNINFRKLTVKGFPNKFPESIEVDISKLRIGQKIRVKDVNTGDLVIVENPEAVICSIKTARGAVDTGEDEGEDAPVAEAAAE